MTPSSRHKSARGQGGRVAELPCAPQSSPHSPTTQVPRAFRGAWPQPRSARTHLRTWGARWRSPGGTRRGQSGSRTPRRTGSRTKSLQSRTPGSRRPRPTAAPRRNLEGGSALQCPFAVLSLLARLGEGPILFPAWPLHRGTSGQPRLAREREADKRHARPSLLLLLLFSPLRRRRRKCGGTERKGKERSGLESQYVQGAGRRAAAAGSSWGGRRASLVNWGRLLWLAMWPSQPGRSMSCQPQGSLSYLSWASSPSRPPPRSSFPGTVAGAPAAVPAPTSSQAGHPANQGGEVLLLSFRARISISPSADGRSAQPRLRPKPLLPQPLIWVTRRPPGWFTAATPNESRLRGTQTASFQERS